MTRRRLNVSPAGLAEDLGPRGAALTSTLHWFETELLTREENLMGLRAVNRESQLSDADRIVLDMDSSKSPVHGQQEGSAYNGHFETVCYHPLFYSMALAAVSLRNCGGRTT